MKNVVIDMKLRVYRINGVKHSDIFQADPPRPDTKRWWISKIKMLLSNGKKKKLVYLNIRKLYSNTWNRLRIAQGAVSIMLIILRKKSSHFITQLDQIL